jgi:hypothetical protein
MSRIGLSYFLGMLTGWLLLAIVLFIGRMQLLSFLGGLWDNHVQNRTVVSQSELVLYQDGVEVGRLKPGVHLHLESSRDKFDDFSVALAWERVQERDQVFAPAPGKRPFLMMGTE